jgi:hypothetical protein
MRVLPISRFLWGSLVPKNGWTLIAVFVWIRWTNFSVDYLPPKIWRASGWPDWSNFRLLGDHFTLGSFCENYRIITWYWAL